MIQTSRIASGFDVELQLGGGWFVTAINLLIENGVIDVGFPVTVSSVEVVFDQGDWDLKITASGFPVLANVELSDDASELTITTDLPDADPIAIPFGALKDLAEPPVLVKLEGDADHEPVIAILANLDIHAESQAGDPLPDGEFEERGDETAALSFLPTGEHIAFGMGKDTYQRFANNLWHTQLRADGGTHPLPDQDNKVGTWSSVSMSGGGGSMNIVLQGDIPADTPLIDIIPDPHVTITIRITPTVTAGKLSFQIEPDTDVDTGLLGDLLGAFVGGIVGFLIGLATGGILLGAAIGAVAGIIVVEIAEVVVEGIVQQKIQAKINGEPVLDLHCNEDGIVQIATPDGDGFDLSVLDAIPSSVAVYTENPDDEFLYKRSLLVTSLYDDVTVNGDGFAAAGTSGTDEAFEPEVVELVAATYDGTALQSLTFQRDDGEQQGLPIADVFSRAAEGELVAPFKLFSQPDDSTLRIPAGKLACVCLKPHAIRRQDTIVEEIEFESGVKLYVADAIALQDAAGLIVQGYQLIHPRDYNAYYRAKADFFIDNNFEELPEFGG
jgi:uncharacterized protein YcfJ